MTSLIHACTALWTIPDSVWKWIHRLGGPGLILFGVADNTPFISAPPGSVDLLVILLSARHYHWWAYYALMATVGEVIGGYITYRVAEKGGQQTLERQIGNRRAQKLYHSFEKRGTLAIFSGAMLPPPFPFTSVLLAAGVMQYPCRRLLSALTTGRALRFFALAFLSRIYGQQLIGIVSRYYCPMIDLLVALAMMASISAAIYFYRRKAQTEKGGRPQRLHSVDEAAELKTQETGKR